MGNTSKRSTQLCAAQTLFRNKRSDKKQNFRCKETVLADLLLAGAVFILIKCQKIRPFQSFV